MLNNKLIARDDSVKDVEEDVENVEHVKNVEHVENDH